MGGRVAWATRTRSLVLAVALGAAVLLPAAPAAAHNSLTGSDPADGARVATAPTRIALRFLATPARDTTKITVTGPDDAPASTGVPTVSGKQVAVPFTPGPPGVYTVAYRVTSIDGHEVHGKLSFTLTTGAATASPVPTTVAPTTSVAPTTAPASQVPAASRSDDDGGTARWWVLGAAVMLLALGAGLLLRRRAAGR